MTMTDQEIVLEAIHRARVVLGNYIEPGPRDCAQTISTLLKILDDEDVAAAVERLDRRRAIQLVRVT